MLKGGSPLAFDSLPKRLLQKEIQILPHPFDGSGCNLMARRAIKSRVVTLHGKDKFTSHAPCSFNLSFFLPPPVQFCLGVHFLLQQKSQLVEVARGCPSLTSLDLSSCRELSDQGNPLEYGEAPQADQD